MRRFVWVYESLGPRTSVHAVLREQSATYQDALCGTAPAVRWALASGVEVAGGKLRFCAECRRRTSGATCLNREAEDELLAQVEKRQARFRRTLERLSGR